MTKFDYLYKRVFNRVFDCYRTLFKHLLPFLDSDGDSFRVPPFRVEGVGCVSFRFDCKSSNWAWNSIRLVSDCSVHRLGAFFSVSFANLQNSSVSNLRILKYLFRYFDFVAPSVHSRYDELISHVQFFDLYLDKEI